MMPYNTRHTVREYAGGSVGGILRKGGSGSSSNSGSYSATGSAASANIGGGAAAGEARQVDLLVFGYACKVFRDDDKARVIDQGKHLIPWMGDNSLKIDRYDVRGALSDLAPHEPPPGGYGNRLDYLSTEEQRAELLCEEERYLYLYNSEEQHILQQEEDLKRLKQDCSGGGYNQVAFQYSSGDATSSGSGGVQHGPSREEYSNSPTCEEAEQAFSLPRNFEVPASIQLPETMKQHAIIEKTARFIASQGVQMEILLKAKQSNNMQFEFLSQNSILNPYYKFVVNSMKNGTYPKVEGTTAKDTSDLASGIAAATSFNSSTEVASLFGVGTMNALNKPIITVPTIKYKPSANCAYTQLISKIKGVPLPAVIDDNATMLSLTTASSTSATNSPRPDTPNGSNFTPVLLQYNGNTYVTAADGDESNSNSNTNSNSADARQPQVELLKNSSALALAQDYLSDSEDTEDEAVAATVAKPEPVLNFPVPIDNLKNIIDKTATYVIKNGRQFEETLRTKSEERFTFLLHDNEHYPYYMYKITGDPDAASKEQKTRKAAAVAAALLSKKGLNVDKTISPVSFSIKPKDDATTSTLPPVLPQENSDDDEVDQAEKKSSNAETVQQRTVPEHVQKAIQLVEIQLMARNAQLAAVAAATGTTIPVAHVVASAVAGAGGPATNSGSSNNNSAAATTTPTTTTRSRFDIDYNSAAAAALTSSKTLVKSTKAEMERNALFEQQQQNRQKELKKAEEKVKDKLAQIAREKLGGLISKEKQLQLERKRKAMAFLNQIKGTPPASNEPDASSEKKNKTEAADDEGGNVTDDSDASVHSIPITSYGPDVKTDDEEDEKSAPAITTPLPPQFHVQQEHHNYKTKNTTVMLSDDDDVQLVGEIKAPRRQRSDQERYKIITSSNKSSALKRRSRSRTRETGATTINSHHNQHTHNKQRKQQYSSDSSCSSSSSSSAEYETEDTHQRRHSSKSSHNTHKSSKAKKSSSSASVKKSSRHSKKKSKKQRRSSRSPSSRSLSTTVTQHHRHRSHRSKSHRHSRSRSSHRHNATATHRSSLVRSCSMESDGDGNQQQQRRHHELHYTSNKRSSQRRSPTPPSNMNSSKRKEKKRKYEYER